MIVSPSNSGSVHPRLLALALTLILVGGYALRLLGLDWDDASYLHPDERHIVADVMVGRISLDWPPDWSTIADPARSTLNPRPADPETGERQGFAYGTLPLYATELVAEGLTRLTGTDWHAYGRVHFVGRLLSILLDTGTILLVFLLGRHVAGDSAALLGALFYAVAPIALQLAHFFTVESWITFFATLSLLAAARGAERGALHHFALAGGAAGLALASKSSVAGIVVPTMVAVMWDGGQRLNGGAPLLSVVNAFLARGTVACAAFLACFALGEPFALLDGRAYIDSIRLQIQIQTGALDVPFTRQYIGTPRGWYQVEQLLRWGLGPVSGVLALLGCAALAVSFARRQRGAVAVILTWLVVYGLAIILPDSKFARYLLPIVPLLAVAAGALLAQIAVWLRRRGGRLLATGAVAGTVALVAGWGVAYASISVQPHARLDASAWLLAHAPPGMSTSNEVWDDRLPISVTPGLDSASRRVDGVEVNLYQDFPTYGDARQLIPVLSAQRATRPVAVALEGNEFETASQLTDDGISQWLATLERAEQIEVSKELARAAARMTTSRELQQATVALADTLLGDAAGIDGATRRLSDVLAVFPVRTAEGHLYSALSSADFYVVSSNRVMTGVERSPWRYPVQSRFYDLLFAERLGYDLVQEFVRYPTFGPVTFEDDTADESFINYDHPHVWIFAKRQLIAREAFAALMHDVSLRQTIPERAPATEGRLLLDRPVAELPVVDDARWSAALTGNSWWALVVWVLLLVALQVAGWPLAAIAFSSFPDRGWAAARLLALLLAGWLVWFLASAHAIAFRAVWCGAALALVAALGWWWWRSAPLLPRATSWRSVAGPEAVFWGVFALFLLFRYLNPDSWHPYWGGEKPMEFAHLNAILRSAHFPPYDPWYAGGYLNYYYYGTYLVAYAVKLTGIPSEIAFNLAQPTVIALLAALAYSVAAAIGSRLGRRPYAAALSGLVAVVLVSFGGNMLAAARLVESVAGDLGPFDPFQFWVWDAREVIPFTINEFPYFTGLYADLHAHVVAWPITVLAIGLCYALGRDQRTMLLAMAAPRKDGAATRLVALRLGLLALTLGSLAPTNAWDVATYAALFAVATVTATALVRPLARRLTATLLCATVVVGMAALAFLPFFANYVALFRSLGTVEDPTPFPPLLTHFGAFMVVLLVGLVTLMSDRPGSARLRWLTPFVAFMGVFGLLLVYWYVRARQPQREEIAVALVVAATTLLLGVYLVATLPRRAEFGLPRPYLVVLAVGSGGGVGYALLTGRPSMALYLAFGLTAVVGWLAWHRPTERFVAAMIAAGMLAGATFEVVFLVDNLARLPFYRMNTVFKFYNQLWVLFALAAAALVPLMARSAFSEERGRASDSASLAITNAPPARTRTAEDRSLAAGWGRAGIALVGVVSLMTLAYPITATLPRLETQFSDELGSRTLNALTWMDDGTVETMDGETLRFAEDRAVINWFNTQVEGTPVIAEASFGPYRCNGSRISIATGLPTVIGWVNHQTQQRNADDLGARENAMRTLYTSEDIDEKRAIIGRYSIDYIVVGDLERQYPSRAGSSCVVDGSRAGIAAFDELVGSALEVAFRSGQTIVYRVV